MLVPADSVPARGRAGIKFLGFHPLGAMGNFHLGAGAAPLPRPAGLCLALLSGVFKKRFTQERTWDPLPAWNWGLANQSVILEEIKKKKASKLLFCCRGRSG